MIVVMMGEVPSEERIALKAERSCERVVEKIGVVVETQRLKLICCAASEHRAHNLLATEK
jgi:hypothetical protein